MRRAVVACVVALVMVGCRGSEHQITLDAGLGEPSTTTVADPERGTATTAATAATAARPAAPTTSSRGTATAARPAVPTTTSGPAPQAPTPPVAGWRGVDSGWRAVDSGPLATRGEPKAVWTGREVIVVGGLVIDQYQALADGAAFDPASGAWRRIAVRPSSGRVLHAAWTGTEVLTFGSNHIDLDPLTTAYAYNPSTDRWRPVPLPPSTKSPHAVVWTGRRVLIWQPGEEAPGALYDPAADAWTPIPVNSVPGAVSAGAATWTGDELAVEGAVTPDHGGPVEQRLFLFDPARATWRVSSRPPTELSSWPYQPAGSAGRQVAIVGPPAASPSDTGTTLIYDPATDRWRSVPAPFPGAQVASDGIGGTIVFFRMGPLFLLDVVAAHWSTSGDPPGPVVGDGVVVSTGGSAFVFGITSVGNMVDVRQPNGAYLWTP